MTHQLLFVCSANVCRSPLMAVTFEDSVATASSDIDWVVLSRGVSVVRSQAICSHVATLIGHEPAMSGYAESHRSAQLTDADLDQSGLVIAASREERARAARVLPSSRSRTFTLKEAVALAGPPFEAAERERVLGDPTLQDYAAFLDRRRGRIPVTDPTRLRLPWRTPDDPHDVPDVHHGSDRRHNGVLREARDLVQVLHSQIEDFLGSPRLG